MPEVTGLAFERLKWEASMNPAETLPTPVIMDTSVSTTQLTERPHLDGVWSTTTRRARNPTTQETSTSSATLTPSPNVTTIT